jgi:HPt (histidine-containing phosphotransfer) domain-containing protein
MDEAADDQMADVMRGLRAAYLDEAPERVRDLSAALGRLRLRDRSALEDIQRYFHRLAGSGGSYGFPDVTTTSRAAEVDVRQIVEAGRDPVRADFEMIEAAILALSSAFHAARQDFERGVTRD